MGRKGEDKFMSIPTPHTVIPAQAGTQTATQAIAKPGKIVPARLGPDFRQDDGVGGGVRRKVRRRAYTVTAFGLPSQ